MNSSRWRIAKLGFGVYRHAFAKFLLGLMFATCLGQVYAQDFVDTDAQQSAAALAKLDQQYQEILDAYLSEHASSSITKASDQELRDLMGDKYPVLVNLRRIREHQPSIINSQNDDLVFELLNYLYEHNDTATVRKISDHLKNSDTPVVTAKHYLMLAHYYWSRGNWEGTRAALSNVKRDTLHEQDQEYYYLLMGYALQRLKDHRKAYRYYRRIPPSSIYYSYAKLNEGTAYLRQGWWTEAFIEFENAIENAQKTEQTDVLDRLYVTMGYAQLTYEFYRDARLTLRNVSIDGQQTHKALMGLGLAAAYQKDFAGAINAFAMLSEKTPSDTNVDEAMLLLPKAYEEVGNLALAQQHYEKAIKYYEKKLLEISAASVSIKDSPSAQLALKADPEAPMNRELLAKESVIPAYAYQNFATLLEMNRTASVGLSKKINRLLAQYATQIKQLLGSSLEARSSMVNSYLSQAKLGMAKLYDQE